MVIFNSYVKLPEGTLFPPFPFNPPVPTITQLPPWNRWSLPPASNYSGNRQGPVLLELGQTTAHLLGSASQLANHEKKHMAVCQNLVPLVNIKIAGKWMFIPLKMVLIGIDPYPVSQPWKNICYYTYVLIHYISSRVSWRLQPIWVTCSREKDWRTQRIQGMVGLAASANYWIQSRMMP